MSAKRTRSRLRAGRNGGHLRTGNPGNRGGKGRVPKADVEFWRGVLEDPKVQKAIMRAARNPNSPAFAKLIVYATDRVLGKPHQALTVSGTIEGTGVLAVPMPLDAEQWGKIAAAQQEQLLKHPPATNPH